MVEGLQDTLRTQPADFCKIYLEDSTPVRFARWNLKQTTLEEGTNNSRDVLSEQEKELNKCRRHNY